MKRTEDKALAIIGISCRFPLGDNPRDFCDALLDGQIAFTEVPPDRFDTNKWYSHDRSTPLSTDNKWIAPIADADRFDYSFFGLSRAEARNMDPQQRLVLEESWRAFEDAGLSPSNLHGVRCGVLVGAMNMSIRGDFGGSEASTDHAGLGSFANMLANRVSHAFRLNGPSMVTDSACASGIVALHEANRLIHSGDCDMALVAGVNLNLDPWKFVAFSKARMTSPSGACRPFDSKADGYIMGDGVGAVLATSIETAEKLGCHIHGLVLGTAIRHCAGAPTITAPSATMQCETILAARNMAGIHAMDYVEAHGTGTSLGDPIEIEGLRQANASAPETKEKRPPYPVASLKGNVGHLEGAAGMAGLIKVLSMFKAREIPPTAGLTEVNPIIDLDSTGLRLPREREPWTSDTPLVAGVSSFGIGGVMAHAVLQEPPAVKNRDRRDRTEHLFTLSADDKESLERLIADWRNFIHQGLLKDTDLPDACATLWAGRSNFAWRTGAVVDSIESLQTFLEQAAVNHAFSSDKMQLVVRHDNENAAQVAAGQEFGGELSAARKTRLDQDLGDAPILDQLKNTLCNHDVLASLGIQPTLVTGNENDLLPAMAATGLLSVEDAAKRILGTARGALRLKRPVIPFLDPVSGEIIYLSTPTPGYVTDLLKAIDRDLRAAKKSRKSSILADMVRLAENQFTFKKMLEAWNDVLPRQGAEQILRALHDGKHVPFEDARLAYAAGLSSLELLRGKWELPARKMSRPLNDLITLMGSGILDHDAAAKMLLAGECDLTATAEFLQTRLAHATEKPELNHLAAKPGPIPKRSLAWLAQAMEPECKPHLPEGHIILDCSDHGITLNALLGLWLQAVEFEQNALHPVGSFRRIPLPTYPFKGMRFPFTPVAHPSHSPKEHGLLPSPPEVAPVLWEMEWNTISTDPKTSHRQHLAVISDDEELLEAAKRIDSEAIRIPPDSPDIRKQLPRRAGTHVLLHSTGPAQFKYIFETVHHLIDDEQSTDISLTWITTKARQILKDDTVTDSWGGMAHGWLASLAQETPIKSALVLDIDEKTPLDVVIRSALSAPDGFAARALRNGNLFEPRIVPVKGENFQIQPAKKGVVVISGGNGAIGAMAADILRDAGLTPIILSRTAGTTADSYACDVADKASLGSTLEEIRNDHGPITGVIHAAGILDDRLYRNKTWNDFSSVVAPKAEGARNLADLTADDDLDFIVFISSAAAVFGNPGQTDYAAASSMLTSLADETKTRCKGVRVTCLMLSVVDGVGMADQNAVRRYEASGIPKLSPDQARQVLQRCLTGDLRGTPLVTGGPLRAPATAWLGEKLEQTSASGSSQTDILQWLTDKVAILCGESPERLEPEKSFFDLGLTSIQLQEITEDISVRFDGMSPATVFQYPSLSRLAAHLGGLAEKSAPITVGFPQAASIIRTPTARKSQPDDIAIIGMSARFPEAPNLDVFWDNLKAGKDCIRLSRPKAWELSGYDAPPQWGGWIEGVDLFDPMFFNISTRDAEQMDPQQRLMLQSVWHTMEDAGYGRRELWQDARIGLFTGLMWNEYTLHAAAHGYLKEGYGGPGTLPWAVPNRVSYFMGFNGPSLALDTACSSSLSAVHEAILSLNNNDCEMAVAGGVNLSIHPAKYDYLRTEGFLSSDGRCRSFGEGGNGYVPGEGIGSVLLKPLGNALADNDRILGIIRGSAINHGGRAAGFTAPNPTAQAELIRLAMERSGLTPDDIGYIECHGTGTELGDPIEIQSLSETYSSASHTIHIGSVKSNIGHLEAAAGMAGLMKVLLSMRHGILPPSLHGTPPNPNIDFSRTPFSVLDQAREWDGAHPRVAALSSFGAGGSNAHLIVEAPAKTSAVAGRSKQTILLSAHTSEGLKEQRRQLADFLTHHSGPKHTILTIAATLGHRRTHFPERAAYQSDNIGDLIEMLTSHENLPPDHAHDWIQGNGPVPKNAGDPNHSPVSLPGYAFARESYWVSTEPLKQAQVETDEYNDIASVSFPLFNQQNKTAEGYEFEGTLNIDDPLFADHVIGSARLLPAAAIIECFRAAGKAVLGSPVVLLDLSWTRPFIPQDERQSFRIAVKRSGDTLRLQLFMPEDQTPFATAEARPADSTAPARTDIHTLLAQCTETVDGPELYEAFSQSGFHYGRAFQVLNDLRIGPDFVLAPVRPINNRLRLINEEGYDPGSLDGALQSLIGWLRLRRNEKRTPVPAGMDTCRVFGPPDKAAWVWLLPDLEASSESVFKADIHLLDEAGEVLVSMESALFVFTDASRFVEAGAVKHPAPRPAFLSSAWSDAPHVPLPYSGPLLVCCPSESLKEWKELLPDSAHIMTLEDVSTDSIRAKIDTIAQGGPVNTLLVLPDRDEAQDAPEVLVPPLLAVSQGIMQRSTPGEIRLVVAYRTKREGDRPLAGAMSGFLRTAAAEDPTMLNTCLEVVNTNLKAFARSALDELSAPRSFEIRRNKDIRLKRQLKPGKMPKSVLDTTAEEGSILITGGTGRLGTIITTHLLQHGAGRIILTGRSAPGEKIDGIVAGLDPKGGQVFYIQADITDRTSLQKGIDTVPADFLPIRGAIHSAGQINDGLIPGKDMNTILAVLKPKISGARNLTRVLEDLNFIIFFSSISALIGNPGQCDYAMGNRFLDLYAEHLTQTYSGRVLSLNWPLWQDSGMEVSEADAEAIEKAMGVPPLEKETALVALDQALVGESGQYLAIPADCPLATGRHFDDASTGDTLDQASIEAMITELVHRETQTPVNRISTTRPLEQYGLGSLMVINITRELEQTFGTLPKVLFYRYKTIGELAAHLATLPSLHGQSTNNNQPKEAPKTIETPPVSIAASRPDRTTPAMPIAIIGHAGRYPMADDLDEYWANLSAGRDCVVEIPMERWDAKLYFDHQGRENGNTYSRWGGFINSVDRFDPLHFNISPREALVMDPQERLFLETVQHTLDNAGLGRTALGNRSVGVFAGCMWSQYEMLGAGTDSGPIPLSQPSGLANRVSYHYDLTGPSMTVDTMCSSSLTAIHLACGSLTSGECEMAVAGGANLSLVPEKYRQLSQGRFLSTDGKCRSFGADGDGYVPGEGVGAILLKPLDMALRDGNRVLGVIRGTAINHGGRSTGYTVPSPKAQADVIVRAFKLANLTPQDIDRIECHGTGTSLGDPIEIAGLTEAFEQLGRQDGTRWPVSSAKSNIGHLEAAAGIAALGKVLLELEHETMAPSLHAIPLNPNIQWDAVPFTVQTKRTRWKSLPDHTRRASISSFGAGGSNAHIIMEEAPPTNATREQNDTPMLLTFSARTEAELRQLVSDHVDRLIPAEQGTDLPVLALAEALGVAPENLDPDEPLTDIGLTPQQLGEWLSLLAAKGLILRPDQLDMKEGASQLNASRSDSTSRQGLADLSYTLQTGPAHMRHRLAIVVDSHAIAHNELATWLDGSGTVKVLSGRTPDAPPTHLNEHAETALSAHDLEQLAALWVAGADIAFDALWTDKTPRRVCLPPYPFTRKRYWYDRPAASTSTTQATTEPNLHQSQAELDRILFWNQQAAKNPGNAVSLETIADGVALITMRDTENRNMFTDELVRGLVATFGQVREQGYRAVILTGSDRVFSFGATPDMLRGIAEGRAAFTDVPFLYRGLLDLDIPVVAAINGHAFGGGFLFGLTADVCILSKDALYSAVFTKYGFTPGMGATLTLNKRLGDDLAKEMMFGAAQYTGEEVAARSPLRAVDSDTVLDEALAVAAHFATKPLTTLRILKKHFVKPIISRLPETLAAELAMHEATFRTPETAERIQRHFDSMPQATPEASAGKIILRETATHTPRSALPMPKKAVTLRPLTENAVSPMPRQWTAARTTTIATQAISRPATKLPTSIAELAANILGMNVAELDNDLSLSECGLDSIGAVELARNISRSFSIPFEVAEIYDHPSVERLTTRIATLAPQTPSEGFAPIPQVASTPITKSAPPVNADKHVAIIGLSCRFPGADNEDEFWNLLMAGRDSTAPLVEGRFDTSIFSEWGKMPTVGLIDNVAGFDADFFSITPMEAEVMDPQQRLVLMECWRTVENAGIAPGSLGSIPVGVYLGAASSEYETLLSATGQDCEAHAFMGLAPSVLASRIAYVLDLSGECLSIDTACSSSLVAIHQACRSIVSGENEMALAGGVMCMVGPRLIAKSKETGIISPSGTCRPFDEKADGTNLAEGVGVVMLKRLDKAISDNDPIRAVILASATNQDGRTNGITAPSAKAQQHLLESIYSRFAPESVGYIEAHGTGTNLGDPIEFKALNAVFPKRADNARCALGSLKANIGHTTVASGVAGLIKSVLSLEHDAIPPQVHFDTANPRMHFADSAFKVSTEATKYATGQPRRAGISSFGFSGTNCHVLLEQGVKQIESVSSSLTALIPLSAKSEARLALQADKLLHWLTPRVTTTNIHDIAHTLLVGRDHHPMRTCLSVSSTSDLEKQLAEFDIHRDQLDSAPHEFTKAAQRWIKGDDAALNSMIPDGKRINLPGTAFELTRHWPEISFASAAVPTRERVTTVAVEAIMPLIEEHTVMSRRTMPGTGFLDLMAAMSTPSKYPLVINDVHWGIPFVEDNGHIPKLQLKTSTDSRGTLFRFTSQIDGHDDMHASGCLLTDTSTGQSLTRKPELKTAGNAIEKDAFYDAFGARGIKLGPWFRRIETIQKGERELVATLRQASPSGHTLHAGILDAIFQTVSILADDDWQSELHYLPVGVERIEVLGDIHQIRSVHAIDTGGLDTKRTFDVHAYDEAENTLLAASKFTVQRQQTLHDKKELVLLAPQWIPAPEPSETTDTPVVVVCSTAGLAMAFDAAGHMADILGEGILPADSTVLALFEESAPLPLFNQIRSLSLESARNGIRLTIGISGAKQNGRAAFHAISGFIQSLKHEMDDLHINCVLLADTGPPSRISLTSNISVLMNEARMASATPILIKDGQRFISRMTSMPESEKEPDRDGAWIITGGLGSVGRIIARHLHETRQSPLILVGRNEPDANAQAEIKALKEAGAGIRIVQADISNRDDVAAIIRKATADHGIIAGVIHGAGVLRDAPCENLTDADAAAVIAPKAVGAIFLREALDSDIPLICLSSIAALSGFPGQTAYAFANGWMDGMATEADARTVSINWPLWSDGTMKPPQEIIDHAAREWGLTSLPTKDGLAALDVALNGQDSRFMVGYGHANRMKDWLNGKPSTPTTISDDQTEATGKPLASVLPIMDMMIPLVEGLIKRSLSPSDFDKPLGDLGFDSIVLTRLAERLNAKLGSNLSPADFFAGGTLNAIARLVSEAGPQSGQNNAETVVRITRNRPRPERQSPNEPVAIVGMAARFPQSPDMQSFWNNLIKGRRLISEVPADRFDWRDLSQRLGIEDEKASPVRWGGFIDNIDRFDTKFFNISRREARLMDPQQRIFLELCWQAVEQAGHAPTDIAGSCTGVFAGVSTQDYFELCRANNVPVEAHTATGMSPSVLVNRVSFLMDLHGPSEPVDTACSSSLVALDRAVGALQHGDCDAALVGGIGILISETLFESFAQAGMLSTTGQCSPFDARANGYVRAEGAGVAYLKPLSAAKRDKDPILGLIRSTAVNHGGRAASLTAPNADQQAEVIIEAIRRADIDPATLGWVETHGTGTPLGDPIEINGLRSAFKIMQSNGLEIPERCMLGAVKSNVGHLEAAAGMAGLAKVLLSLQNSTIPPNADFTSINPLARLEDSPLQIITTPQPWTSGTTPRRAGLSSFGFGGTCAHVILEEAPATDNRPPETRREWVLPLSGYSRDHLVASAQALASYLKRHPETRMDDCALTLCLGRTHHLQRMALVAKTTAQAVELLDTFTRGDCDNTNVFAGEAATDATISSKMNDPRKQANAFVCGTLGAAALLPEAIDARRIALPGTIFLGDSHWAIPRQSAKETVPESRSDKKLIFTPDWERVTTLDSMTRTIPDSGSAIVLAHGPRTKFIEALAELHANLQVMYVKSLEKGETPLGTLPHDLHHIYCVYGKNESSDWFTSADLTKCRENGPGMMHRVCRQLARDKSINELDLTLITDSAFASEPDPVHTALHGMLKSVAAEMPRWSVRCIDATTDAANALVDAIHSLPVGASPVRIVNNAIHKRILIPTSLDETAQPFPPRSRHLIIGGAGGVGSVLARHLARTTQAHLIVAGRREPDYAIHALLAELNELGGSASYRTLDARDPEAVDELMKTLVNEGGLVSVVHSAMLLSDVSLTAGTDEIFETVFNTKVNIAANLIRAMVDHAPHARFINFSSIVPFAGNPGQCNYAAASSFGDGLALAAAERFGLNATTINWSWWGNIGAANQTIHEQTMKTMGVHPITPESGMAALDQIVGAKIRQGIVVDAEPRALRHIGVTNIPKTEPGITDLMQSLDRLCAHITLDVFTTAGLDTQWRTVEELGSELGIASRHETLFSEMSRILIRAGYAEPNGQAMRLGAKVIDIPSFNTMAARIEKKHPRIAPHIRLLKACADKYTDVLSGRLPATEAIFPNGDTSLAEAIYGDTPFTAPGNRKLAEVLSDLVSTGEANILEVGAGTGATTAVALDTLRQAKTPFRYCYTDIAHALLMAGKRRFGESDDLEYRLFDLNAPCAEQGFQPNSFDVVIASNVLHTAPDLDEALRNITESIAPGGTLIIIELTRVMAFNTMIFGLLDEWWAPANHPERLPGSPLLASSTWSDALEKAGFHTPAIHDWNTGLTLFTAKLEHAFAGRAQTQEAKHPKPITIQAAPKLRPAPDDIQDAVTTILATILDEPEADLEPRRGLAEFGMDSILTGQATKELNDRFGIALSPTDLFNYPTIESLASYITTVQNTAVDQATVYSASSHNDPLAKVLEEIKTEFDNADDTESHSEVKNA